MGPLSVGVCRSRGPSDLAYASARSQSAAPRPRLRKVLAHDRPQAHDRRVTRPLALRARPPDKLPAVDFATKMVVGVFLGTKPTAGYGVEIVGVKTDGDALVVEYTERPPGRGTMAAQILTQPFHMVSVPRHEGTVRFVAVTSIGDRQ